MNEQDGKIKRQQLSFESAMKKLDSIVSKLESGEVGLEDTVSLYEEGMKLYKICVQKIENAKLRIDKAKDIINEDM